MSRLPVKHRLETYQQQDLLRERVVIHEKSHPYVWINDCKLINFCSSDYLGLATHPQVKQAFIIGVEKYGLGSTGSALICGYHRAHQLLEEKFAEFLQRDRAILFHSGYCANLAVMTTLANKHTAIFADKLCHASLIDAILLAQAKHYRYQHNNLTHLAERLHQVENHSKLIVSESIFSMEGDIANIVDLVHCAQQAAADLLIDDAHGIGFLGKHGAGICEQFALSQKQVPILVTPLGKAFASQGAVVSGSHDFIEALLQFSRPYIYTTALPPAVAHATLTVLDLVAQESWRREKLRQLISFFIQEAKQRSLKLSSENITPIKSIIIGKNSEVMKLKKKLFDQGFLISAIRPPTVPVHTARIRISLNYEHTEQQIIQLLDLIKAGL